MRKIDKKILKLVGNDEQVLEYLPFISDEQKQKHIKIIRGKIREQERRERRILNFLKNHKYELS